MATTTRGCASGRGGVSMRVPDVRGGAPDGGLAWTGKTGGRSSAFKPPIILRQSHRWARLGGSGSTVRRLVDFVCAKSQPRTFEHEIRKMWEGGFSYPPMGGRKMSRRRIRPSEVMAATRQNPPFNSHPPFMRGLEGGDSAERCPQNCRLEFHLFELLEKSPVGDRLPHWTRPRAGGRPRPRG
jgi:hypothetical protein